MIGPVNSFLEMIWYMEGLNILNHLSYQFGLKSWLHALGTQNRVKIADCVLECIIEQNVVVADREGQLLGRARNALCNDLLGLGAAFFEAAVELCGGGGQRIDTSSLNNDGLSLLKKDIEKAI